MPVNDLWLGGASGNVNNWTTAGNWSNATVPVTGDTAVLESLASGGTMYDITAGLAQGGVTLAALNVGLTYTKNIGTVSAYLAIGATLCSLGYFNGIAVNSRPPTGFTRCKINFGTPAATVNVYGSGQSADLNKPAIRLLMDSSSSVVNVIGGACGIATDAFGETSTLGTVNNAANIQLGAGVTLTNFIQTAGTSIIACGPTNVMVNGGTMNLTGDAAVTIAALNLGAAILDLSDGTGAVTVTALNIVAPGFSVNDPYKRLVLTTPVAFSGGATAANGKLNLGFGRTLTISA